MEIDAFVFSTSPQPLYKGIVRGPAFSIHADGDVVEPEWPREVVGSELAALVGIEDARAPARGQGIIEGIDAECSVERVAHLP